MRLQALDVVRAVGRVDAEAAARREDPPALAQHRRERRVVDVLDEVDGGDGVERRVLERREIGDVALEGDVRDPRAARARSAIWSASSDASRPTTARAWRARKNVTSPRAEPSSRTRSEIAGLTTRSVSRFRSSYLRFGFVNQWLVCSPRNSRGRRDGVRRSCRESTGRRPGPGVTNPEGKWARGSPRHGDRRRVRRRGVRLPAPRAAATACASSRCGPSGRPTRTRPTASPRWSARTPSGRTTR